MKPIPVNEGQLSTYHDFFFGKGFMFPSKQNLLHSKRCVDA